MAEPTANTAYYEIRLKGQLNARWADWFDGMTITLDSNGDTLLSGPVVDQAALHGLLKKVRDVGMTLISVNSIKPEGTEGLRRKVSAFYGLINRRASKQAGSKPIIRTHSKKELA